MKVAILEDLLTEEVRLVFRACLAAGLQPLLHEVRELQCIWVFNGTKNVFFDPLNNTDDAFMLLMLYGQKIDFTLSIKDNFAKVDGVQMQGFELNTDAARLQFIRRCIVRRVAAS